MPGDVWMPNHGRCKSPLCFLSSIPQRAQLKVRDVSASTYVQGTEMHRGAVLRGAQQLKLT